LSSFGSEFALLVILAVGHQFWKRKNHIGRPTFLSTVLGMDMVFIEHADLIYDYCIKYDHGCGENSDLSYGVEEIC